MKSVKFQWWIKWALRKALEWVVKQLLEELREGIYVRLVIDGKVYYVKIQLQEPAPSQSPVVIVL